MPVGGRRFLRFELTPRVALLAAASLAALCLAAPVALAQDVPVPRPSPLKSDPASEESLLAAGDAPVAFADDDFEPVQRLDAFEAATGLRSVETAQAEPDGEPLNLVPLSEPVDPFARQDAQQPFPSSAPIDLRAPGTAAEDSSAGAAEALGSYTLEARMTVDGDALEAGVIWRVYADDGADGKMRLVGEADGGPVTLRLKPGDYFVHAAFGRAGITRKVSVSTIPRGESVVLDAGGIRLTALAGQDRVIAPEEVRFDIFAPDEGGSDGRVTVMANAPAATVIGLNAGIYHVICRYGDANAIVRADIRVEAGKLTEVTVYQQAARVTLKLVENHGGEALANTSWSVVTPAGESVVESVGAFPSVVLSSGEYTAIARHAGRIFEQKFIVEAGLNRDVEVLLQ